MRLAADQSLVEFRREFEGWLDDHLPGPELMASEHRNSSAHLPGWARQFQREMFEAGYLVPGWPTELGGRNATPQEQMVYFEVIAERQVPRSLNPQGLSICAASIVEFGTDEQKERFVLPTLKGDLTWCLGMSEPNAGSDLASLTTKAEHRDGYFVVNGQKVWTSGAHDADYCLCYVRTDPEAAKHRGISVLMIDMRTPGISCRSLPELTDPHHADFNEVFFTDVEVPEDNLLGELDHGWAISQGSLRHERGMLWIMNVAKMERTMRGLQRVARRPDGRGGTLGDDPRLAEAIGRLATDTAAIRCLGYRGFAKSVRGEMPPEHMVLKLFSSEAEQRACELARDALGIDGLDLDGAGPNRFTEWDVANFDAVPVDVMGGFYDGAWADQYLRSFSGTIAGGTSEIQRNIIAERVLGMPRG
ncbi:MAG TPA: acyl-CoA dehydrogenase family protein [Acidimicrobiales bacterium]|jgi:alkylation response protein AidB-like acyl-CoA dehydrogenase|nr:acyl-CoA dehydrogenase family protein [Acidimicrobiales bacterium]